MRAAVVFYVGIVVIAAGAIGLIGISPIPATILETPGRQESAAIRGDQATLVSGRRVTPVGTVVRTQSYNWGLAIAPDERRIALLRENGIELTQLAAPYETTRIPPYGSKPPKELGTGSYMG